MMPLVLHTVDSSPPCRAVMMLCNILDIPIDQIIIDFMSGQHLYPDFVEKNPMHSIPMIEDGDFVLADSHAIVTYLISKYGADKRASLYPSDIYSRATINTRLYFDSGILFPRLRDIVVPTIRGGLTSPTDEMIQKVEEAYTILEAYLNKTQYLAMDRFTVADICAGATVTSLNALIPIDCERFPKLIEWYGALHAENCFQEINAPGVQQFSEFINDLWVQNQNAPVFHAHAR